MRNKFKEIGWGLTMYSFKCESQEFVFSPCFNRKPVELLEDRTDMVIFSNLADSAGRVVLETLETLDRRRFAAIRVERYSSRDAKLPGRGQQI